MTRSLSLALAAALTAGPLAAGAQSYSFLTSVGSQPSDVGRITLRQVATNQVEIAVDLGDGFGFLNTGGPHTPFAFQLQGVVSSSLSIVGFSAPTGGQFGSAPYRFTLNTAGGANTPYGSYNVALDIVPTDNGSSAAYMGDLTFVLTGTGLTTNSFTTNGSNGTGYYFSADLTNGSRTGAQAWAGRSLGIQSTVPEPTSLVLLGAGVLGLGVVGLRRRG